MKTKKSKQKHEQFKSLAKEFSPKELLEVMEPYWAGLGYKFENPYKTIRSLNYIIDEMGMEEHF